MLLPNISKWLLKSMQTILIQLATDCWQHFVGRMNFSFCWPTPTEPFNLIKRRFNYTKSIDLKWKCYLQNEQRRGQCSIKILNELNWQLCHLDGIQKFTTENGQNFVDWNFWNISRLPIDIDDVCCRVSFNMRIRKK